MNKTIGLITVTAILFLSWATSWGHEKDAEARTNTTSNTEKTYLLQFNLKDGSTYIYSVNMLGKIKSDNTTLTNNLSSDCTFQVKDTTGGNKKLNIAYDMMKMEIKSGDRTMLLSSEDPSPESKPMRAIIDKSFSIVVNREGNILDVEGWENIDQNGTTSSEELKRSMEYALNIFPARAVKVGESWKKESHMNLNIFKMKVASTYTLTAVKDNLAIVSFTSTVKLNEDENKVRDRNINMSGSQKGTMHVELSTGMALSGTVMQDIEGWIEIEGTSIPMSIKNEISLTSRPK